MKSLDRLRRVARARLRKMMRGELTEERLRRAGVGMEGRVILEPGVWVDLQWGFLIELGDLVTLSPGVMIFAHDAATRRALGHTRVAPVRIGARTYVGAGTIVLPGVTIGNDAIIGAGSVVSRDIPSESMAAGVPARVICPASDYLGRRDTDRDSGLVLGDLREHRERPDWNTRRVQLGEQVRDAGEAWVK